MTRRSPIQPQTVIATTANSAWLGSEKKPCAGRPSLVQCRVDQTELRVESQLKMTPVATVEVTTGTNTAIR